jgi:hypothetical protein
MARTPSQQRLFDALQTRYGAEVARAFLAAIDDITAAADLQRIIAAINAGNIEAAIAAMNIDAAAYSQLLDTLDAAYRAGGDGAISTLPALTDAAGARLVIRFDARNPRAEAWLRDNSAELVTRIQTEQRLAIRQALEAGMIRGENPRTTALDVVGRISRATGKREGGIIGLTQQQEVASRRALDELRSGDPAQLRAYLERGRRDKRFDRAVTKAIRENRPVDAATATKAATQYKNRLLALRGEMIGRTEAMTSLHSGQHEALLQAIDKGAITENQVRRVWNSAGDGRVRHTHAALDGQSVGLKEKFSSPSGAQLMYPGDASAPASERINCRCTVTTKVDFLAPLRPAISGQPIEPAGEFMTAKDVDAQKIVLDLGRKPRTEYLLAYDSVTGGYLSPPARGTRSSVSFSNKVRDAINDPARKIVAHHNHPSSASLSPADVLQVANKPGLKTLWAHGHDGSIYKAEAGVKSLSQSDIDGLVETINGRFNNLIAMGENISVDDINNSYWHMVNVALNKQRRIVYDYRLSKSKEAAFARLRPFIEQLIREIDE